MSDETINLRIGKKLKTIELCTGETWQWAIPITDALNAPVPLDGATITLVARQIDNEVFVGDPFNLSVGEGISIDDNIITIDVLNTMACGVWYYKLKLELAEPPVAIINGKIKVKDFI